MSKPSFTIADLNLSLPLPIKTVLCIPSLCYAKPCQTLHGCAMPLRIIAILSRCESMSINAVPLPGKSTLCFALAYALTFFAKPHYVVPLLCCPNQHLRITQSFTGSLCRSQCYS
nr:MAG TPA: hypothetical protein [Caudoviricetes sp.]